MHSASQSNTLPRSLLLHSSAFFSGFITMALEMLIGRTFIPYFGGTIYTWGALISVFLIGMTIGYVIGGRTADRKPSVKLVAALFFLSAFMVMFVPLYGETIINLILDQVEDMRYAALLAAIAIAAVPAAFLAAISPFCVRLLLDSQTHSGAVSGRLSALCTAGSIVGTLGTTFFFIPTFGMKAIYACLAGTSLLVAALLLLVSGKSRRPTLVSAKTATALGLSLAGVLAIAPPDANAQDAALLARPDGQLERIDSEYNTIFVEKQGSTIALNFGYRNNRYTESVIDLKDKDALVISYTRFMSAALAFNPNAVKKIGMVGMGGGRTIKYLVDGIDGVVADVAEIDPSVITVAKKYFGVQPTPRLRIHAKDGRIFLNQSREKYDLILLDAYRGPFVPFHLTTQEFYKLVQRKLNDGGVVAQNVEPTTMFFDSAYRTMKSIFDQVDFLEAHGNIVLVGYSGKRLTDQELAERAGVAQGRYKMKYDLRELVKARKVVQPAASAKILTDDFAPVENLKTIKRHNEKLRE